MRSEVSELTIIYCSQELGLSYCPVITNLEMTFLLLLCLNVNHVETFITCYRVARVADTDLLSFLSF